MFFKQQHKPEDAPTCLLMFLTYLEPWSSSRTCMSSAIHRRVLSARHITPSVARLRTNPSVHQRRCCWLAIWIAAELVSERGQCKLVTNSRRVSSDVCINALKKKKYTKLITNVTNLLNDKCVHGPENTTPKMLRSNAAANASQ